MKKYFQFEELGTNYRREILGGFTTFLAMAYILVVNPLYLTLADVEGLPDALRMDYGAVFVATAVSAAIGCFVMGIVAKYPLALSTWFRVKRILCLYSCIRKRKSLATCISSSICFRCLLLIININRFT